MTTSRVIFVRTEEVAVVCFRFTMVGFGTEGIAALSASYLPGQPCCLCLDRLGYPAVVQALASAFNPSCTTDITKPPSRPPTCIGIKPSMFANNDVNASIMNE